jgi:hypothetical protein
MTLQGNTLFAGDSMTVGLAPFVQVNGEKRTVAAVGRTSAQLLAALREPGVFAGITNMVVLIGANDIGGRNPEETVLDIWAVARHSGVRVFAMTVPPNKGWSNFASNFPAIEARRKALNARLGQEFVAGHADGLVDLSVLMADPADPQRLAAAFDSGDHLHPRKDAMGALLTTALDGAGSFVPGQVPGVATASFPWVNVILLVGIAVGGTILLARKDSLGSSFASRVLHRIS